MTTTTETTTAADIMAAIREVTDHPVSVAMTGGNVATVYVGATNPDGLRVLAIGSGRYNYETPEQSTFDFRDLWVVRDGQEDEFAVTSMDELVAKVMELWVEELLAEPPSPWREDQEAARAQSVKVQVLDELAAWARGMREIPTESLLLKIRTLRGVRWVSAPWHTRPLGEPLVAALDEMTAAYDEGEPDRCGASIQPVIDAWQAHRAVR